MLKILQFKKLINYILILILLIIFFGIPLYKLYIQLQKLSKETSITGNNQIIIDDSLNRLENEIKNFLIQQ